MEGGRKSVEEWRREGERGGGERARRESSDRDKHNHRDSNGEGGGGGRGRGVEMGPGGVADQPTSGSVPGTVCVHKHFLKNEKRRAHMQGVVSTP